MPSMIMPSSTAWIRSPPEAALLASPECDLFISMLTITDESGLEVNGVVGTADEEDSEVAGTGSKMLRFLFEEVKTPTVVDGVVSELTSTGIEEEVGLELIDSTILDDLPVVVELTFKVGATMLAVAVFRPEVEMLVASLAVVFFRLTLDVGTLEFRPELVEFAPILAALEVGTVELNPAVGLGESQMSAVSVRVLNTYSVFNFLEAESVLSTMTKFRPNPLDTEGLWVRVFVTYTVL